jgi:hypothetical protein
LTFRVLCASGDEARHWRRLIEVLPSPLRDIHFLPEYADIYRASYGYEACLALLEADEGYVLQPFVRRPLRELPFLAGKANAGRFSDMANPYGYGGPLCSHADAATGRRLYARFAAAFSSWCDEEDIASEFTSLHPFMAAHQRALVCGTLAPRHEKDVVFIDLASDEGDIRRRMRKGHRSSAAVARRAAVRVEKVEPSASNLALFGEMYTATMVRRQAAPRWFVPQDYFANCVLGLGVDRTSLFFARIGDEIESACLLIHDFSTAYYHFAAGRAQRPELGVNNLMVYETARWAKDKGFSRYHLGGGVTSGEADSLLRFKAGFSDLRAPLYTYFCVRDRLVYDQLCERKRAHEQASAAGESASEFVPLYRR